MSQRNRPGRDQRIAQRDASALAEAVKAGQSERAKELAAEILRKEAERLARMQQSR